MVETEDTDNPVVALEDSVALTPQPGSLASWPSIYQVLCTIVVDYGVPEEGEEGGIFHGILFSQLKPLLQKHWHSSFDESSLSYLTEEGSPVKLKKMKHLLQAVLRWREQRVAWKAEAGTKARVNALDEAMWPRLELMPSKRHNDLLLRCAMPRTAQSPVSTSPVPKAPPVLASTPAPVPKPCTSIPQSCPLARKEVARHPPREDEGASSPGSGRSSRSGVAEQLEQELAALRAENARLRSSNYMMESHAQDAALRVELFDTPSRPEATVLEADIFDNPFEPPPEIPHWSTTPPVGSPALPSNLSLSSGSTTPSQASGSHSHSGSATPVGIPTGGQASGQVCALVPMWFSLGDRLQIPNGVVQQARAVFERSKNGTVPSFFAPS